MANVVIRLNCKKKFSLKTSDFRIKALVDFMRSDAVYETPELYLMARLCGLQPRYDTIRPGERIMTMARFNVLESAKQSKT